MRAGRENLERAWARQRDPNQIPGGNFQYGVYSKDLKRTAALAGENPRDYARLQARLWESFPPANELQADRLRGVGDRIWRVRRVVAGWAHRERLAFYDALFEAAAKPNGIGLEALMELSGNLGKSLDFYVESMLGLERRLAKQQGRLAGAVEQWCKAVRGEAGVGRQDSGIEEEAGVGSGRGGGGRHLDCLKESGCSAQMGAELAWQFAQRGWALPKSHEQASGYRMHWWLVRAAVVGGNRVVEEFGAELESAIGKLAQATWMRLSVMQVWLELAREQYEQRLQKRDGEGEEQGGGAVERALKEALKAEGKEEETAARMLLEKLQEKMREVAKYWGKGWLQATELVADLREKNRGVQQAFMGVVKLLAAEVAAATGGESVA